MPVVSVAGAAYTFHTANRHTALTYGPNVNIGDGVHKITAFKKKGDKFLNMGTAVFESAFSPGANSKLTFRWVRDAASAAQVKMVCLVENAVVTDLSPKYRAEMKALMAGKGYLSGLNRFWTVDWESPFRMPGWAGIREINVAVPGWKAALPWLQWHALGSLGLKSFDEGSFDVQKSVFGVAIGAVGYLTGYEHEAVDDTCSQFCSMGTNNDCDDFAVAAAAVITSVLRQESPPCCALEAWIVQHVNEAHVVTGMAWPRMAVDANNNKITCGHMWVEASMKGRVKNVVVECTAGVIYYGGVKPTSATVRTGNVDEEYSPVFEWYADRVVDVESGDTKKITLPPWVADLAHASPAPKDDDTYNVSVPGKQIAIYGAYATRLNAQKLSHGHHINVKFLPFTTGTTTFMTMPLTTTYAHHDVGSYA